MCVGIMKPTSDMNLSYTCGAPSYPLAHSNAQREASTMTAAGGGPQTHAGSSSPSKRSHAGICRCVSASHAKSPHGQHSTAAAAATRVIRRKKPCSQPHDASIPSCCGTLTMFSSLPHGVQPPVAGLAKWRGGHVMGMQSASSALACLNTVAGAHAQIPSSFGHILLPVGQLALTPPRHA